RSTSCWSSASCTAPGGSARTASRPRCTDHQHSDGSAVGAQPNIPTHRGAALLLATTVTTTEAAPILLPAPLRCAHAASDRMPCTLRAFRLPWRSTTYAHDQAPVGARLDRDPRRGVLDHRRQRVARLANGRERAPRPAGSRLAGAVPFGRGGHLHGR